MGFLANRVVAVTLWSSRTLSRITLQGSAFLLQAGYGVKTLRLGHALFPSYPT